MSLLKSIDLKIASKLRDKEYRDQFFENWTHDEIANQLRELRKRRDLRQQDLADAIDTQQSAISRWEQADYSSWSFPTLLKIARVLDARVKVIFEPAEDVILGYERLEHTRETTSAAEAKEAEAQKHYEQQQIPAVYFWGSSSDVRIRMHHPKQETSIPSRPTLKLELGRGL